jgi:hypothetical protein
MRLRGSRFGRACRTQRCGRPFEAPRLERERRARAYIEALRRSRMSLYEVSDIVSGVSFLARDLVRGGEPVPVFERSATRSLS